MADRVTRADRLVGLLLQLLDQVPEAAWIQDGDGRYLVVNRAFEVRHGVRREEVLGRRPEQVLPLDDAERDLVLRSQVLRSGLARRVEVRSLDDGVRLDAVELRLPLADARGRAAHVGGVATDRTEVHRLRERLFGAAGRPSPTGRTWSPAAGSGRSAGPGAAGRPAT